MFRRQHLRLAAGYLLIQLCGEPALADVDSEGSRLEALGYHLASKIHVRQRRPWHRSEAVRVALGLDQVHSA